MDNYEQVAKYLTGVDNPTVEECKAHIDRVNVEMERLRTFEPKISLVDIQNGTIDVEMKCMELVQIMAGMFGQYLDEVGAKNYGEIKGELKLTIGMAPITITIQRHPGKTPHECRVKAEAKWGMCKDALSMLWEEVKQTLPENSANSYKFMISGGCKEIVEHALREEPK